MNLGDAGRSSIKGHDIAFYQDSLREVREKTLAEFAKHDDAWLLTPLKEPGWGGGPVNNYCLWFHVCEHISHHAGQIDFLMKRLPGAKPDGRCRLIEALLSERDTVEKLRAPHRLRRKIQWKSAMALGKYRDRVNRAARAAVLPERFSSKVLRPGCRRYRDRQSASH
jgi:hypothetical protein